MMLAAVCGFAIAVFALYLTEHLLVLVYDPSTFSRPSIWRCLLKTLLALVSHAGISYLAPKVKGLFRSSTSDVQSTNTIAQQEPQLEK